MLIRDRIKEFRRIKASELRPNPKNWRVHPQRQRDALCGVLAEIGYADAVLVRELPDGTHMIVDGHLRAETTPEQMLPCLVLDVDEAEADKLLATLDPLAAAAEMDAAKFSELVESVDIGADELRDFLDAMLPARGETELRQLPTQPPPPMAWALIGIPTVRFAEIAEAIEAIGGIDGVVLETTAGNEQER